MEDNTLEVVSNRDGGTIIYISKKQKLEKNVPLVIRNYMHQSFKE
jgi:hypothetical protein